VSRFREVLDRQGRVVDELQDAVLFRMAPALDHLRIELERDMAAWLNKGNWDEALEKWSGRRDLQAQAQIVRFMRQVTARTGAAGVRLSDAAGAALPWGARRAAGMGLEHMIALIEKAGGEPIRLDIAAAAILDSRRKLLLERYGTLGKNFGHEAVAGIRLQLQTGILRNETYPAMVRRIMQLGRTTGELAAVGGPPREVARGLVRQQRANAVRLVRTEGQAVYNEYSQRALELAHREDALLKRRWDAARDRVCPVCRALDLEVRGLREEFTGGIRLPPAHPHCCCTIVPWRDDWEG
jgi:hypothetical protein